jgi:hypothetical protein
MFWRERKEFINLVIKLTNSQQKIIIVALI